MTVVKYIANLYAAKAAVTFVIRNKSNQKYFLGFPHSATADGLNSDRLIGTQMCIPITVTAIKIKLTLYVLSAAYGHSLVCFFGHNTVSLLRSGSQHLSFFVGWFFMSITCRAWLALRLSMNIQTHIKQQPSQVEAMAVCINFFVVNRDNYSSFLCSL